MTYTGRAVATLKWIMDREKGVRSECTLKILSGTGTNRSVNRKYCQVACKVPKYVTSDHVLRLSVSTKCECDERVSKEKNIRIITETYNHAKV